MSCQCYQVGGPFIAEDPECVIHGARGVAYVERQFDEWFDSQNLSHLSIRGIARVAWIEALWRISNA